MNKRIVAILAATTLAVTLTGCGGDGNEGDAKTDPGKPIKFYLSGDGNQGGGFAKMAAQYEKEKGVKVEIVDIPNEDIKTKVKNAAQADDLPALANIGSIDPIWKDKVTDLKEIAEASKVDMDLAAVDPDGKVLSIPSDVTGVGMFLNTTLWDKAGVKYPKTASEGWTWDEFVAAAKQVQEKSDAKYSLVFDRSSHRLNSLLFEFGSNGFVRGEDGKFSTNDKTRPALEYFKKLNDDKFMPKSVWTSKDDPNALFKSGQVTSYYSGSWQIADFAKNIKDFKWASVPAPHQPVRAVNYGNAGSIVVFEGTGQTQAAKDFISWLYTKENYTKLCEYSGMLPARADITPKYSSNKDAFELYNAEMAASPAVVPALKQQALKLEVEGFAVDGDPLRDEVIKYVAGEQEIDATMTAIVKRLNEGTKE